MVMKLFIFLVIGLQSILYAGAFEKGKSNIGFSLGAGSSFNQTYTIAGINGSYFVMDNLAVGVRYRGWFGATPTQQEIAIETNYYIPLNKKFHPYLGAFVRQTFISSDIIDDFMSYGGRAGVAFTTSRNSFISVGYAIETYSKCQLNECSSSYPELIFGLSF